MALKLRIQIYQILVTGDEVCITSLFIILLTELFLNLKLKNQYWHIYCEGQDQNEEALEKIMTEEKSLFQPLQVDPEILEELVGSDVEKKVQAVLRLHGFLITRFSK